MTIRFACGISAFAVALVALAGCSHEPKPDPETASVPAPPFFTALTGAKGNDEPTGSIASDEKKSAPASGEDKAGAPGAIDVNQRLASLELDMAAMKIELSRLNELDSRMTALEGSSPHSAAKLEPVVAAAPPPKLKVPEGAGDAPLPVPMAAKSTEKASGKTGKKGALLPEDMAVPASVSALEPRGSAPAPAPAATPAAEPAKVAMAAHAAATGAKAGDFAVQLAAYSSPQGAAKGWTSLSAAAGPLLADLSPKREEAEVAGLGTLYRLKAGPFASSAEAEQRCASLKAEGHSCLVTRFDGVWP